MTTSKSPKRVALTAYEAAKQAIPLYSHRRSPFLPEIKEKMAV